MFFCYVTQCLFVCPACLSLIAFFIQTPRSIMEDYSKTKAMEDKAKVFFDLFDSKSFSIRETLPVLSLTSSLDLIEYKGKEPLIPRVTKQ